VGVARAPTATMNAAFRSTCASFGLWFLTASASGAVLPEGTTLSVRLTSSVSSRAKPGDPVEAVLIAPVHLDDSSTLGPGTRVLGQVAHAGGHLGRPRLGICFDRLIDLREREIPLQARVVEVDNARETVTKNGLIVGLPGPGALPSQAHTLLLVAAHAHPLALALFEFGRLAQRLLEHVAIRYGPGVEMTLATDVIANVPEEPEVDEAPLTDEPVLEARAGSLPLFAVSGKARESADLTNILVIGSGAELEEAFEAAGWARAETSRHAKTKAFLALAEHHGYKNAPVSLFRLDGRRPDVVFEKENNTMAKRHHVRFWRLDGEWAGRSVWLGAATHDVAIVFDRGDRSFTHRVDPEIDREREKVVSDLVFTGAVVESGSFPRPWAPTSFLSRGTRILTDGQLAVLELRAEPQPAPIAAD